MVKVGKPFIPTIVIHNHTNKIHHLKSGADCAKLGLTPQGIKKCCRGEITNHKGYLCIHNEHVPESFYFNAQAIKWIFEGKSVGSVLKRSYELEEAFNAMVKINMTLLNQFKEEYPQLSSDKEWALYPTSQYYYKLKEQIGRAGQECNLDYEEFMLHCLPRVKEGDTITIIHLSQPLQRSNIRIKATNRLTNMYSEESKKRLLESLEGKAKEKALRDKVRSLGQHVDDEGVIPPLPVDTIILTDTFIREKPMMIIRISDGQHTRFTSKKDCAEYLDTSLFQLQACLEGHMEAINGYYLLEDDE
ncbi:gp51 [Listeria phage P35]|uniref:gp51 n=1 Tax=Listeria phage P35 TaxID=330398 RepID=UPI00015C0265|nr:gp51 [Listeria phage P35]AAY53236.1 gp51 [Listeria phage P35]